MYTYYGLAAFGPAMQKYLWWKRYLTVFQMIQFVMIFTHAFQLLFINDCGFPKIFAWWIGSHGVLFWFLFSNFYEKTYTGKKDRKPSYSKIKSNTTNGKLDNLLAMCNGTQNKLLNKETVIKNRNLKNGLF